MGTSLPGHALTLLYCTALEALHYTAVCSSTQYDEDIDSRPAILRLSVIMYSFDPAIFSTDAANGNFFTNNENAALLNVTVTQKKI